MLDIFGNSVALAQAANQTAQPSIVEMLVMPVGFLLIMYFLIIRPQQRRAKDQQNLIANLKVGEEVVTTGGVIGRIKALADSFVTLEVSPNTNIKVTKASIVGLTKGDKASK